MAEQPAPLVSTKLYVPQLRQRLVARPRLLALLDQSLNTALTLVCAPAGYGKTTLLSAWVRSRLEADSDGARFAWVSLDPEDNDPLRFIRYLAASLEAALPGSGEALDQLGAFPVTALPPVLTPLINTLNQIEAEVVLALDDYQFITNPAVHEGIIFLLDHLPPNLHLLIAARSDPPLPLARLRARGQLREFRAEDLRFSGAEASEFLNQAMALPLSAESVAALEQRTEGWIAGLQMAAVAAQGHLTRGGGDITRFVADFSGSHRYILDYLAEEVLNHQPPAVVDFLLSTSILERLSAPLCGAVLGEEPSAAQETLEHLDRTNLFLASLDDERGWFRYHHLFAGLLQARLNQAKTDLVPQLHRRAAAWFEENGWIGEAVQHANQAQDWETTARLVEQNLQAYLERGQLSTILKWMDALPQERARRRPMLCIRIAEALAHAGQMDRIVPFLEGAEAAAAGENLADQDTPGLTQDEANEIRALAAMLRGFLAVISRKPDRGLAIVQAAISDIPRISPRNRAWLHWTEGYAFRGLGDLPQAYESFTQASRFALESGMTLRDIWTDLAITTQWLGRLPEARAIFSQSLEAAAERGSRNQGNLARDEAYLSGILLEQNRLEEALAHARKAVDYTRWWPSHNHIATANAFLACALLANGDLAGSQQAIALADQERQKGMVTPFVHSLVDRTLARVWLAQGDWEALEGWEKAIRALAPTGEDSCTGMDEYREARLTALTRLWLEKTGRGRDRGAVKEALDLLACLEENARAARRANNLIEILALKAGALQVQGRKVEALKDLQECLRLAEPGGYVRVFVDVGEPLRDLLAANLRAPEPAPKSYALALLEAFPEAAQIAVQVAPPSSGPAGLVEPLTGRELDVLRLMAAGYSNRRIAEELVLAEGTVKYYVHAILEKLGVHSRTQAILAAKEHRLI